MLQQHENAKNARYSTTSAAHHRKLYRCWNETKYLRLHCDASLHHCHAWRSAELQATKPTQCYYTPHLDRWRHTASRGSSMSPFLIWWIKKAGDQSVIFSALTLLARWHPACAKGSVLKQLEKELLLLLLRLLLLLLLHPFNRLFSNTTWVSQYQKGKTSLDFKWGERWWSFGMQWH